MARASSAYEGDRGHVPRAVHSADHDRVLELPPAGAVRTQLRTPVETAEEQVDQARRLTSDQPRKKALASGSSPKREAFRYSNAIGGRARATGPGRGRRQAHGFPRSAVRQADRAPAPGRVSLLGPDAGRQGVQLQPVPRGFKRKSGEILRSKEMPRPAGEPTGARNIGESVEEYRFSRPDR